MTSSVACYVTAFHPIEAGGLPQGLSYGAGIDLFIVTSSAEIDIVHEPQARQLINACTPQGCEGEIVFISIGCAGVFASVLEFVKRSTAQRCRILALETPVSFVQHTLDVSRLGDGGDGFVAQEAACVVDLSKHREGAIAKIDHCEILARPKTFGGTAEFGKQLVHCLEALSARLPEAEVVTFQNTSLWAQRLYQLVALRLRGNEALAVERWLPTTECDERHFMTVRPLLDIRHHLTEDRSRPLIVTCLGAGGRLGVMALQRLNGEVTHNVDLSLDLASCFGTSDCHDLGEVLLSDETSQSSLPERLRYTDNEFYGRYNFYFHWTIRHASHKQADQHATAQTHAQDPLQSTPA